MWVLEGHFGGIEDGPPQRKLLKPGRTYLIGRKAPADIIIAGKTVSREAASLIVAPSPSDAITQDPSVKPTVTLRPAAKPLRIIDVADVETFRADANFVGTQIEQGGEAQLKDGDVVVLARSVPAPQLVWVPMAWCLDRRRIKEPELSHYVARAAELGISVAREKNIPGPGWTHWVTASTGFTPSTLLAVCHAAWIVTKEYADELLRLGSLDASDPASLEAAFALPDASAYMPPIATELDDGLTPATFAERIRPDPQRPTLFRGTTMVLVHDQRLGREAFLHAAADLARASGAAAVEECDVSEVQLDSAASVARYLRPILARATSALAAAGDEAGHAPDGGLVVLVVEPGDCQGQEWYGHLARCTRELEIRMPDAGASAVTQSVIHATPRVFLNSLASVPASAARGSADVEIEAAPAEAQPTPGFLPAASGLSAHGEQPAQPTASTILPTPAPTAPAAAPAEDGTPAAPKPLRRRAAAGAKRDPLGDLFGGSSAPPTDTPTSAPRQDAPPAKPSLPASQVSVPDDPASTLQPRGLKRRAKTARAEDAWDALLGGGESSGNPPAPGTQGYASKSAKYRQELEEADARAQSQQPATQAPHESAELSAEAPPAKRGRIASPEQAQDAAPDEDAAPPPSNGSVGPTQQPAVVREEFRRDAASPAKLGKDAKFLQALATQRNSKKADNFDREFDRLHIAVGGRKGEAGPAFTGRLDDDEDDQGYLLFRDMAIDDLDLDSRQGFIQVDFVSLVRKDRGADKGAVHKEPARDVPNFKKFRKVRPGGGATKPTPRRAMTLDLAEGGDDFGLGGDAEGDATLARAPRIKVALDEGGEESSAVELMAPPPKGGQRSIFAELSDSEGEDGGGGKNSSRTSRVRSTTTPAARGGEGAAAPVSSRASARLDEEEGDSDDDVDVRVDDVAATTRGKGRATTSRARGAKRTASAAMDLDDDEDDSFIGVGSRGRKKTRGGGGDDDDDDDDGDFAGFGVTRTPSRRAARAKKGRI